MRAMKFRGKRIDNGEWVYGAFYPIKDEDVYFIINNCKSIDFDLKLIQFTAEDLIDFSEEYVKKVAIASLEKASENAKIDILSAESKCVVAIDKFSITNKENIVL